MVSTGLRKWVRWAGDEGWEIEGKGGAVGQENCWDCRVGCGHHARLFMCGRSLRITLVCFADLLEGSK